MKDALRWIRDEVQLPAAERRARRVDRRGLPGRDPGLDLVIAEGIAWLCRAQDASGDGGFARVFSVTDGWNSSYPETTGYIVPTLLEYARAEGDDDVRRRALRALDWLVDIQLENGGFQGGMIDSKPVVPVTFNTGQVLLGLAAGAREDEAYRGPMRRAAEFLATTQDNDGCWRKHPSPFAEPGEKSYETHVAWGLFEAARIEPDAGYGSAGLRNIRWALGHQRENGWFEHCCLSDDSQPLTHTLGYALRGVLEAFRFSEDPEHLEAAVRTADGLLTQQGDDGRLAGCFFSDWRPAVPWVCLTGLAQVAHCWLMLFQLTGELRYRDAGFRGNRFVRRTIGIDDPPGTRGAVKGSFPIDGDYGTYEYPNWACKFSVDSNVLERAIRAGG